jgi:hypothetical protein
MSVEKKLLNAVHEKAVFKRRVKVLSRLLSDEIHEGKSVLDLGCAGRRKRIRQVHSDLTEQQTNAARRLASSTRWHRVATRRADRCALI